MAFGGTEGDVDAVAITTERDGEREKKKKGVVRGKKRYTRRDTYIERGNENGTERGKQQHAQRHTCHVCTSWASPKTDFHSIGGFQVISKYFDSKFDNRVPDVTTHL